MTSSTHGHWQHNLCVVGLRQVFLQRLWPPHTLSSISSVSGRNHCLGCSQRCWPFSNDFPGEGAG